MARHLLDLSDMSEVQAFYQFLGIDQGKVMFLSVFWIVAEYFLAIVGILIYARSYFRRIDRIRELQEIQAQQAKVRELPSKDAWRKKAAA